MNRPVHFWIVLPLLAAFHVVVLFAGFFAPYNFPVKTREMLFAAPTRLHLVDARGKFHLRPFVYVALGSNGVGVPRREETRQAIPVRFFVHADAGEIPGRISSWHLFGVDEPARVFLFGTDSFGRDQFSRFLYGGRISIVAGWLAAGLSLALGALIGSLSGFYGKALDQILMRGGEVFLAFPWLYLFFVVRAFLPFEITP